MTLRHEELGHLVDWATVPHFGLCSLGWLRNNTKYDSVWSDTCIMGEHTELKSADVSERIEDPDYSRASLWYRRLIV